MRLVVIFLVSVGCFAQTQSQWPGPGAGGSTPIGAASGDLGGTYPGPSVVRINGAAVPASQPCIGTNSGRQLITGTCATPPASSTEPQAAPGGSFADYSYTAANGVARSQTQINAETISVLRLGALGDCSHDDTAAFQSFFTNYALLGYKLWVPAPPGGVSCIGNNVFYKVTASITIPLASGWQVEGPSGTNTQIRMATSNTPMFVFTKEGSSMYAFRNLYLSYATQQTSGSNPLSAFFYLNPDTQTGVGNFLCTFDHILMGNGFRGWDIAAQTTTGEPWWRSTWSNIEAAATMTDRTLNLAPVPTIGVEGDTFENIINYQAIQFQWNLSGLNGGIMRNISFLGAINCAAFLNSNTSLTMQEIHIEAHTINGGGTKQVLDVSGSNVIIDGITYSGTIAASTVGQLVRSSSGGGSVKIRQAVVAAASIGAGGSMSVAGGASSGATYWALEYKVSGGAVGYVASDPIVTNGQLFLDNNKIFSPAHAGILTATFAPQAGAGTGATAVCATSHVCDSYSGEVTLTAGSVGTPATGSQLIITTGITRTNQPNCTVTVEGGTTFLGYTHSANTTTLTVSAGVALAFGAAYEVTYVCGGQ